MAADISGRCRLLLPLGLNVSFFASFLFPLFRSISDSTSVSFPLIRLSRLAGGGPLSVPLDSFTTQILLLDSECPRRVAPVAACSFPFSRTE